MKTIGIGIDYSNICKDYNTAYLDRDNKDPETSKCMRQVVAWTREFLSELTQHFGYKIYTLNSATSVEIDEVASNRFLFYSLEKEITLQSFAVQKESITYDNITAWVMDNNDGLVIQNDEDGEGIYLYLHENSELYQWVTYKLKDFSVDEIPYHAK
jgi:hypothetical protein